MKETEEIVFFAPDGSLEKSFRVRILINLLFLAFAIFIIVRYERGFWAGAGIVVGASLSAGLLSELISPMKKEKKTQIEV